MGGADGCAEKVKKKRMFMEEDDLFETLEVKAEGTSNTQIHARTHTHASS